LIRPMFKKGCFNMKWKLNRDMRRQYENMSKKQLLAHMPVFHMEAYNEGVRDSFMSLLLKLHDEFNFNNEDVIRLLQASEVWMNACISGEEDIDSDGIKKTLVEDGIVCLLETDL